MKFKRHAKILEIIKNESIETQEELSGKLREAGFDVTQATVSRDIKELRLVKSLDKNGKYKYNQANINVNAIEASKFHSVFTQSVIHVDYAMNLLVLKCHPGMGQAAAASVDAIEWNHDLVGTIAGDDTVLIVARNEKEAVEMMGDLTKVLDRS